MAIGATTVFELRPAGNDLNGGGFNSAGATPGTDRSQQTTPHVTIDGVTITATVHTTTTQLNIVGYTVSAADIRNICRLAFGAAALDLFEITAVDTVNNRWTVDRSNGVAGTNVTGRMGGCWGTMGSPAAFLSFTGAAQALIYATGSFSGNVACNGGSSGKRLIGYGSVRGDNGQFTYTSSGGSASIVNFDILRNIIFDATSGAVSGLGTGTTTKLIDNCRTIRVGISVGNSSAKATNCHVLGPVSIGYSTTTGGHISRCIADACTTGFQNVGASISNCLAINCTGTGFNGGSGASNGITENCTASLCNIGFDFVASQTHFVESCLAYGNTVYGFRVTSGTSSYLKRCAAGGNGTADFSGTFEVNELSITLTANPFTNSAGGDFSLNDAVGGGALVKNVQWQYQNYATTISYGSIGSVEPQSGSSGPTRPTSGQVWPRGIQTQ